jgi:hypothetical protein
MSNPATTLITVQGRSEPPTLESAARQIGVQVADIDARFGIVPIDLVNQLYAVQVRSDRLPEKFIEKQPYPGPYSEPRIEPFRPSEKQLRSLRRKRAC